MRRKNWVRALDYWLGIPLAYFVSRVSCLVSRLVCYETRNTNHESRILLIKFAGMGDTILLVPVVRRLRTAFPNARFHFLCSPVNKEAVFELQLADVVEVFEPADCLRRPWRVLKLAWRLYRKRFDLVIDFEQWMRTSTILAWTTGAPRRLGFDTPRQHRAFCFTETIPPQEGVHEIFNFARLASLAAGQEMSDGIEAAFTRCIQPEGDALSLSKGDALEQMRLKLQSGGWRDGQPLVLIQPGCGSGGRPRQWTPQGYAAVADALFEQHEAFVVLTGGSDDAEVAQSVQASMHHQSLSLVGQTSFAELAALVALADVVICPNTGIMHLAAAIGKPTVALHGPTNPVKWGPLGRGHTVIKSSYPRSPCLTLGFEYCSRTCPCMKMIPVGEVLTAAQRVLDAHRVRSSRL